MSFQAPTGERTTGARCWMVVIDESSSMSSADSLGTRADAVRATAEFLAAYGLDGDRIGETWFADYAEVHRRRADRRDFAPSGATHDVGSGTEISAGPRRDLRLDDGELRRQPQPVLVLVSDGQASSQPTSPPSRPSLTGRGATSTSTSSR